MEKYLEKINFDDSFKRVKIDVGLSYNAPQSRVWLDNDNDLCVFGFEPNPECVNTILSKNIVKKCDIHSEPIKNEDIGKRFFLIPVALGNVDEPSNLDFYCMERDCGTSSLLKPNQNYLGDIKEVIKVPVYSLKHFFDVFPWDKFEYIEYIKIDAQGLDLEILKGAGDYLKERVVYITAEPESNQYENSNTNTIDNITSYLKTQNFEKINHSNTDDPTYLNNKFSHLKDSIFIFQKG